MGLGGRLWQRLLCQASVTPASQPEMSSAVTGTDFAWGQEASVKIDSTVDHDAHTKQQKRFICITEIKVCVSSHFLIPCVSTAV